MKEKYFFYDGLDFHGFQSSHSFGKELLHILDKWPPNREIIQYIRHFLKKIIIKSRQEKEWEKKGNEKD